VIPRRAIISGLLALLLAPAGRVSAKPGRETLFVSILPQKFIVEKIAGSRFQVVALVGPGQSPATFDPGSRQMARLAQARALLPIGLPFESVWLPKIRAEMPGLAILEDCIPPADSRERARKDSLDPHFWTSPIEASAMALRVRDALERIEPAQAEAFRKRADALVRELEALDREIASLLETSRGSRFMVFHPAWGHFAERYGLTQRAIERNGKPPGPRSLAEDIRWARALDIGSIFVQKQFGRDSARAVAAALGAELVVLDPLAEDYIENLRASARAIAEALR